MDTRSLRNVLGCFATGVALLTTRTAAGEHAAVTINSFTSVSLDPALVLFSLLKSAGVLKHFEQGEFFSVNFLSHRQEPLSNTFARPSTASFEGVEFTEGENGCALLGGCLAQLECRRHEVLDGGDHRIFVARVLRWHMQRQEDPLLFYRGRYGTYLRDPWGRGPAQIAGEEYVDADPMVPGWG